MHRDRGGLWRSAGVCVGTPYCNILYFAYFEAIRKPMRAHLLTDMLSILFFEEVSNSCRRQDMAPETQDVKPDNVLFVDAAYLQGKLEMALTCADLTGWGSPGYHGYHWEFRGFFHGSHQATASSSLKLIDFGLAGFAHKLRENAVEVAEKKEGFGGNALKA